MLYKYAYVWPIYWRNVVQYLHDRSEKVTVQLDEYERSLTELWEDIIGESEIFSNKPRK